MLTAITHCASARYLLASRLTANATDKISMCHHLESPDSVPLECHRLASPHLFERDTLRAFKRRVFLSLRDAIIRGLPVRSHGATHLLKHVG